MVLAKSVAVVTVWLVQRRDQVPTKLPADLVGRERRVELRVRATLQVLADCLLHRAHGVGHGLLHITDSGARYCCYTSRPKPEYIDEIAYSAEYESVFLLPIIGITLTGSSV